VQFIKKNGKWRLRTQFHDSTNIVENGKWRLPMRVSRLTRIRVNGIIRANGAMDWRPEALRLAKAATACGPALAEIESYAIFSSPRGIDGLFMQMLGEKVPSIWEGKSCRFVDTRGSRRVIRTWLRRMLS